jgi:hypothetical protein
MAAQGQAGGLVVEQNVFAFGRVGQQQGRLVDGHGLEQAGRGLDRGRLPDLLAPVAGQRKQGVGGGQRIDLQRAQPGA